MTRLRTIHVGVAGRGAHHLRLMSDAPQRFEFVAAVDVVPAHLEAASTEFHITPRACFSTLPEALEAVEADAVIISTPVRFHGEQIEQALEAGKHVLVEKPFTIDTAQAERLVRLAEAQRLKLMVGQSMRIFPALREMARLVHTGAYGRVGYFNFVFHKARGTPYPPSPHQQLWQMSVHDLDAIRAVIPARIRRVFCREMTPAWTVFPTAPAVSAILEFADGVSGVYLGSSDSRATTFEMRVECEGGALVQRTYRGPLLLLRGKEEQTLPTGYSPENLDNDAMMSHLLYEYVTAGVEPDISGRNNLDTMRLLDACIRSIESGRATEIG